MISILVQLETIVVAITTARSLVVETKGLRVDVRIKEIKVAVME